MRVTNGMINKINQRVYNSNRSVGKSSRSSSANALLQALSGKLNLDGSSTQDKSQINSTLSTLKTGYTKMQKASVALQDCAEKLLDSGEESLFAKAKESGSTEDVVSEIEKFVNAYNDMYTQMDTLGGNVNTAYVKQLNKFVTENKAALKEIGITQAKDGTLTIKEKTLKSAELEKLQTLFGTDKSFADKIADKAGNVEGNADANLNAINSSSYNSKGTSSFNRYNSYSSNYNARG